MTFVHGHVSVTPRSITFTINAIADRAYTGSAIQVIPIVKDDKMVIVDSMNYTVTYEDNINVGTAAKVHVTGIGNYAGSTGTGTFTIISNYNSLLIEPIQNQTYTAVPIRKVPVIFDVDNQNYLVLDVDFTVTYSTDVTNVGKVTVNVIGMGVYEEHSSLVYYDIVPALLTINGTSVADKTYDGTTSAVITLGTLSGVLGTDVVTVSGSGSFTDCNKGTKTVQITHLIGGSDSGNYYAPVSEEISANILAKQLTITDPTLTKVKVYDGTVDAVVTAGVINGIVEGEEVYANAFATYDNMNVGIAKTITVTYVLTGVDHDNYLAPVDYITNDGKITPVLYTITFEVTPLTAILVVKDSTGNIVEPASERTYLLSDGTYTYVASKLNYNVKHGSVIVDGADQTVNIILSPVMYSVLGIANPTEGGSVVGGGLKIIGSSVTLTAFANAGYEFVSWDDGTTNPTKTFVVTTSITHVAIFKKLTYTITFDSNGGTIVSSITGEYGTVVTAPVNPTREGYAFENWYPTLPVTVPAGNVTCVAQWDANQYIVSVIAGIGGTASGGGIYDYGTSVLITAMASDGYEFVSWSDGGVQAHSVIVGADITLTAVFKELEGETYTINIVGEQNGRIIGNSVVESEQNAVFYIIANADYKVKSVFVDGVYVGNVGSYKFLKVTADHTISAIFEYSKGTVTEVDEKGDVTETTTTIDGNAITTIIKTTTVNGSVFVVVNIRDTYVGIETTASKDGAKENVQTIITVNSVIVDKTATVEVDCYVIVAALAQAKTAATIAGMENSNTVVEILATATESVTKSVFEIPVKSLKSMSDISAELKITSSSGSIILSSSILSALADKEGDILTIIVGTTTMESLNEEQKAAIKDIDDMMMIIELSAFIGTTQVYELDGVAKIVMPYTMDLEEDPDDIEIWFLSEDGSIEKFTTVYDETTRTISFETTHFSYYAVMAFESYDVCIVLIIVIALIVFAAFCFILYRRKSNE